MIFHTLLNLFLLHSPFPSLFPPPSTIYPFPPFPPPLSMIPSFPLPQTFPPFPSFNLYSITPNTFSKLRHIVSFPKSLIESIAMTVDGPSLLPLPPSAKLSLPTFLSSHSFSFSQFPPFFGYSPFPLITHFISLSTSSPCVSSPMTPFTNIVCVPKSTTHILWMKCVANAYR